MFDVNCLGHLKEGNALTTHSTHFSYGQMVKDKIHIYI